MHIWHFITLIFSTALLAPKNRGIEMASVNLLDRVRRIGEKRAASVILAALIASLALMPTNPAWATVFCNTVNFTVEAYDHGGTYLHGKVGGHWRQHLVLCGKTSGAQDCTTAATDRRTAIATTAFALGKSVRLSFKNYSDCAQVQDYDIPTAIRINN